MGGRETQPAKRDHGLTAMIRTTEASRMAVSLAFATTRFLLLATACSPSGKPAAPHRSPTAAPAAISPPVPRGHTAGDRGAARRLGRAGGRAVLAAVAAAARCQAAELRGRLRMGDVHSAVRGRGRHCAAGADSTVTPFAARSYVVGHADTGHYLKITVGCNLVLC